MFQAEGSVGEERRLRGRVWGSPAGADDDAAPPAALPRVERHAQGPLPQPFICSSRVIHYYFVLYKGSVLMNNAFSCSFFNSYSHFYA